MLCQNWYKPLLTPKLDQMDTISKYLIPVKFHCMKHVSGIKFNSNCKFTSTRPIEISTINFNISHL